MVRSGGYRCGIPVAAAKQVSSARRLDRVPGSDPRLLGLAQIGGEPVAVVDLHALLDPDGAPGGSHELTVVIRRGDGTSAIGLAVDEAFGVAVINGEVRRHDADPDVVLAPGGRNLMIAVDLTQPVAPRVKAECVARGLLIITVGDQMLRLLPPMVLTEVEAERGIEILAQVLTEMEPG